MAESEGSNRQKIKKRKTREINETWRKFWGRGLMVASHKTQITWKFSSGQAAARLDAAPAGLGLLRVT